MLAHRFALLLSLAAAARILGDAGTNEPVFHLLVPGFTVEELPVHLSNQNNLRFGPDGVLTSLGYDGRVWRIRDTDGDGLEDTAEPYWDKPTLSVPVGMAWCGEGLYVASHGKVSLLRDTKHNGRADTEEVVASGWPPTDVGSGGVDAASIALDPEGNVYFGLLSADYSNAYRLRKRKDLTPDQQAWAATHAPSPNGDPEEEVSLYDLHSQRGTIQKLDPRTKRLTTVATGIRVPYTLAFNAAGDLFNTDQEGETWMPNGNPLDELNLIRQGHNYGFPPRHPKWLPDVVSDAPIIGFGPQHQSSCGLVFNDPHGPSAGGGLTPATPAQGLFGPEGWRGNAFVAGESRGKIWRVQLAKIGDNYVGREFIIARASMLVLDVAISPRGDLYVCCHSGQPDWGTGPNGPGRIFRLRYTDPKAPQPLGAWARSATETAIRFDRPIDPGVTNASQTTPAPIEFGAYVRAADRWESVKPSYAVVFQQEATPRGRLQVLGARLEEGGRTLVLSTAPHSLAVRYAVQAGGVKNPGAAGPGTTVDLDYDLTEASRAAAHPEERPDPTTWSRLPAWALAVPASSGTDSRAESMTPGDWEDGRGLFYGPKFACSKCHRTRGEGATAGPDLTNLAHRDYASVLRDIRDPNATLHPDYVTYQATLDDQETVVGFLRAGEPDQIRLVDVTGKESTIPRARVRDLRPTGQSLMPTGLLDQASDAEVRNLLTFLLFEPPVRSASELEKAVHPDSSPPQPKPIRLILAATAQDHGPGQHDYPAWQAKWARLLSRVDGVTVETAWQWPSPPQLAAADAVVFYGWNHDWSAARLGEVDALLKRGGGFVALHAGVIADKEPEGLAQRLGLSAQPVRTGYRHTLFNLEFSQSHPLAQGLPESLYFLDEPYWPMIGDPAKVRVLASAKLDNARRPLIWTLESGQGRVFASVPGHYAWTLDDPWWRLVVLRGIAWAAHTDEARFRRVVLDEARLK